MLSIVEVISKVLVSLFIPLILLTSTSYVAEARSLNTQIKVGKVLFAKNCTPCHGVNAIGQNPERPNGGEDKNGLLQAPALNGTGHSFHHSDRVLFKWIKKGSDLEESPMRGWEERMTDEEVWSVINYFRSLWPKKLLDAQQKLNRTN